VTPNVSGSSNSRPCDVSSAVPAAPTVNSVSSQPAVNSHITGQSRISSNTSDG